ncbi:hypothetical protein TNIN_393371 [Trichonephila inaurata madagascariensis]|uniref:Uncharacterized protein n=1 Tax=Trichonephila inaurata madagascariensis TaxID=2747483 RepID=A0A8X6YZ35_9ARAC|nr:hypothetical protein TNIN_393371 [Trichonephila inaurata madagascariensis]
MERDQSQLTGLDCLMLLAMFSKQFQEGQFQVTHESYEECGIMRCIGNEYLRFSEYDGTLRNRALLFTMKENSIKAGTHKNGCGFKDFIFRLEHFRDDIFQNVL